MLGRRCRSGIAVLSVCLALIGCKSASSGSGGPTRVEVVGNQVALGGAALLEGFASLVESRPAAAVLRRQVHDNPDLSLTLLGNGDRLSPTARSLLLGTYLVNRDGEAVAVESFSAIIAARLQGLGDEALSMARAANHAHLELICLLDRVDEAQASRDVSVVLEDWKEAFNLALEQSDPTAWHRLLESSPPSWPDEAGWPSIAEAWARSAWSSLNRHDAWTAFLDYRRAQSFAADETTLHACKLGEARALLELQRPAEAALTLKQLLGGPLERPALALLGSVEAGLDHLASATRYLEASLAGDDGWPGAGRALADLATTQLLAGQDQRALETLTRAGQRLERDEDWEGLACLLANEAAWAELRGHGDIRDAIDRRLLQLESVQGIRRP